MTVLTMRRTAASLSLWLVAAVFVFVLALLIISIARTLRHVQPVRSTRPPVSAVVWGDRVFSNPAGLAHWLRFRGVGYSVWAHRHPPADHVLKVQRQKNRRLGSR
jgi:hypothetical protein